MTQSSKDKKSQAKKAYEIIEEMIVGLKLKPGARVSEKYLSELLGLGRTPVREALQRLATEGTVVIAPRAGIVISEIDIADQFRLIEVRRELERIMAGRAALLVTQEERIQFTALASEFNQVAEASDENAFITTDREFNNLLASTARNKYALLAMSAIQAQTRRFWYLYFKKFGDLPKVSRLHANIALAIASGNEKGAKKASDELIDYVEEYTTKTMKSM
ncbi:MAG: GntR family transcriptional regulator [Burkholderiaceae bacterium]|nr:GntR family transcriptional regulator [Burkholderiaceae bacterium]